MKRNAPIRQVSARRAGEAAERRRVVAAVLERDEGRCTARWTVPEVECSGPADVHEVVQRSLWPAGYLVPANCITLCRAHHRWIDSHICDAHELGLLRHSWEPRPE